MKMTGDNEINIDREGVIINLNKEHTDSLP